MFASPAKNSAQCTLCTEQTTQHLGTKRLQNKLVTTLVFHESMDHPTIKGYLMIDHCNKLVLKSFCSQILCDF